MTERLLAQRTTDDDRSMENVLRPQSFDDYVGQERMKESLRICIDAALQRGDRKSTRLNSSH